MLDINRISIFFLKPELHKFEDFYIELYEAHYAVTHMSGVEAFYYKKTILHLTTLACYIPTVQTHKLADFKCIEPPLKGHTELAEKLYAQYVKLENDYKKMFTPLMRLHISRDYQTFRDSLPDACINDSKFNYIKNVELITKLERQNILNTPLSNLLEYYYTLRIIYGNCNY